MGCAEVGEDVPLTVRRPKASQLHKRSTNHDESNHHCSLSRLYCKSTQWSTRLQHSAPSAITRATAHPASSAVENTASRRTKRFARQLSARNPVALSRDSLRMASYRPDVEERPGRDERGIFFNHSLVGWAVPSLVASLDATGDNGVRRTLPTHLIIHRRVESSAFYFLFHVAPPCTHWQQ